MRRSPVLLGLVLLGALRCSLDPKPDIYGSPDDDGAPPLVIDRGATGGSSAGGYGGTSGQPESEAESTYLSPVATGLYVWTANPSSDRIALVNAETLAVTSLEAGDAPTYIAAVPSPDPSVNRAVVLNVGSQDAMLFTAQPGLPAARQRVPVHAGANAWSVSANGRWAIAWTRADPSSPPDPTEGLQDITLIALPVPGSDPSAPDGELRAWRLSVGYRPTSIVIAEGEDRAFVVCEPGVTILDLSGEVPAVERDVALGEGGLEDPLARDVSVTPDGAFALVRREGRPEIGVVALATGQMASVVLSGAVTDLDLLADGSRAIAVVRTRDPDHSSSSGGAGGASGSAGSPGNAAGASTNGGAAGASEAQETGGSPAAGGAASTANESEVAVLELPGVFDQPDRFRSLIIRNDIVGSVAASPSGERALLYTNAMPSDHLVIVDTSAAGSLNEYRTVTVKVPIDAVFPTPDGLHAIVRLRPDRTTSTKPGAFAVVPLSSTVPPKVQTAEAPVQAVAIGPSPSTRAVVTVSDGQLAGVHATYVVRMPELQVDRVPLDSLPLATGLVPDAHKAFVAQQHPEGRITFIDLVAQGSAADITRTLTGFELAERVVGAGN